MKTVKSSTSKAIKKENYLIFCNFESIFLNNKHIVTCYSIYLHSDNISIVRSINNITIKNILNESDKLIKDFLLNCFNISNSKTNCIFYFHDLNKSDSIFLVNYCCKNTEYKIDALIRDQTYYEIKINKNESEINFRDSYLLFPKPLEIFAETFNIHNKTDSEYNTSIENYSNDIFINRLISCCLNNSITLASAFHTYKKTISNHFNIDISDYLTLTSLALKIYRNKYYDYRIQKSSGEIDSFIRRTYKGGITDVYKPKLTNGYHYDVNALYPSVMINSKMPVNTGKYGDASKLNNFNINNFFGFIEVEVYCPDMYIPFLTIQDKDKGLISPVGSWKDIYFSEEIKYAITLGYKFKYLKYYSFDSEIIFHDYVKDLYNLRLKNKDNALNKIVKLLLNSLYGRFGMKNDYHKCIFINKNDNDKFLDHIKKYTIKSINTIEHMKVINYIGITDLEDIYNLYNNNCIDEDTYNILIKKNESKDDLNNAVQIASAITAYARINMHKYKVIYQKNLYYSDTDSLFLDCKIDSKYISKDILGALKFEGEINNGLFLAPKFYYYKNKDVEIKKIKGINSKSISEKDFLTLYNNNKLKLNSIRNFLRNFKNYTVEKKNVSIIIKAKLKKRIKLYNENNIWTNTKPIKIKNNILENHFD